MTTKVTITGTGMPLVQPHRAGPGVLVEVGDIAMQFDAGRNLIPPPDSPEAKAGFEGDLRSNGYDGHIMVCDDLDSFTLG